ncbi:MAG TPA: beta-propeller domain-containing protein, partial [Polyangiaceae bacterium]|nr:beta-propeller domain-containing protein [Polyangiaceae bacterium]
IGGYDWNWSNDGLSPGTVQVVDISDPSGALVKGAAVQVAGPIQSRWQMDEYEGVFRVVSQPGGWNTTSPPQVQTFRVNSASDIQPLGSATITLPSSQNEQLQSVRFDGPRAYAITALQQDPLFTFDLSDPAHPRQAGQLEMPGSIYHMEPRGNRVYALGYDSTNPDGALNVSLFDVSNIEQPALLSRVAFGGDWGSFAEGQNDIQKAFTILDDQGLILVPFSGGSYDQNSCNYSYGSGIQLVDTNADSLARRGIAPQVGDARRALVHRDHLFGIGDNTVQTFDISNRDAPVAQARLDVARNITTVRMLGDDLLRFGNDWATQETVLDVTPTSQAASTQPGAQIDLSQLFGQDSWSCTGGSYWGGEVFTQGDYAYVPRYGYSYDSTSANYSYQEHLNLFVVDLTNHEAPQAIGSFGPDPVSNASYFGDIVKTDHAILVGGSDGQYQYDNEGQVIQKPTYHYDIFDTSDPSAPKLASRFEVPASISYGGWGVFIGGCSMDMGWGWYG